MDRMDSSMKEVPKVGNATAATATAATIPAGLRPIHDLLTSRGWTTDQTNTQRHTCELTYVKDPSSDDEFRIRTAADKVTVAVPIADAPYLYASSFKSYFAATEFVGKHLETYENKKSRLSSSGSASGSASMTE